VASRAGTGPNEGLGGRKVAIRRTGAASDGHEIALPTFRTMANADPLNVATQPVRAQFGADPLHHGKSWDEQKRREQHFVAKPRAAGRVAIGTSLTRSTSRESSSMTCT
jgi:hypothetical protein